MNKDVELALIELPWPPSANRYWRYWNKKVTVSDEAKKYKKCVKQLYYTWPVKHIEGRLGIDIIAFPPDKRQRDLDNLLKITLDSLESTGLYDNDSQIDKIIIERGEVIKGGCLQICVSEISQNTFNKFLSFFSFGK